MSVKKKISKARRAKTKATTGAQAFGGISAFDGTADSPTRTFLSWAPVNTREETDSFSRVELSRRASLLTNKVPALGYLPATIARHTVGGGVYPIATTTHEEWNMAAEELFDNWASNPIICDHKRRESLWDMQLRIIPSLHRLGEFFALKTRTKNGAPQIQTINPLSIATVNKSEGEGIWDGVLLDSEERRIGYRLALKDSRHRDIPVQAMCHVAKLEREDQHRGIVWGYTGTNPAHDLMDITASERARLKLQSLLGATVTREGGKATGQTKVGSNLRRVQGATVDQTEAGKKAGQYYREQFKEFGALLYLNPGEDLKLLLGPQGAQTLQNLVDYHLCELAWAWEVPPEVVFHLAKIGGAPSRGAFDNYATFIMRMRDLIVEKFLRPIWVWRIAVAMERGELPRCKDPQWWKMDAQGPPDITLDLKYSGTLTINLIDKALMTEADYWSRLGKTWWRQQDQRIREIKRAMTKCELEGVPYHYFRALQQGTPLTIDPEPEEETPKKKKDPEE
jgi:hypothetical protein